MGRSEGGFIISEDSFNLDWKLYEELRTLARNYLTDGRTTAEAMVLILHSDQYRTWMEKPHSFGINLDQESAYQDMLGELHWDRYTSQINIYINEYFLGKKSGLPIDAIPQYDHIFEGLGMRVTPEQLGYEIAQLSLLIGTSNPLHYNHLLHLINGTLISEIDENQLNCLLANEEQIRAFIDAFYQRYRILTEDDHRKPLME